MQPTSAQPQKDFVLLDALEHKGGYTQLVLNAALRHGAVLRFWAPTLIQVILVVAIPLQHAWSTWSTGYLSQPQLEQESRDRSPYVSVEAKSLPSRPVQTLTQSPLTRFAAQSSSLKSTFEAQQGRPQTHRAINCLQKQIVTTMPTRQRFSWFPKTL